MVKEDQFSKLQLEDGVYYPKVLDYKSLEIFSKSDIIEAFNFSYDITFGHKGEQRKNRSGSDEERALGQIFANTLEGKLAEFAFYKVYKRLFPSNEINKPELNCWELGIWDLSDFITKKSGETKENKIAIKSSKKKSKLILLETKDWDENGEYIPNHCKYDFIVFVRVRNEFENILHNKGILFMNEYDRTELLNLIFLQKKWDFDIPGFITNEELIYIIKQGFILKKHSLLGYSKTDMKVDNYYIQIQELHKNIEKEYRKITNAKRPESAPQSSE